MSLYCKGENCKLSNKCIRKEDWDDYSKTFNKTDEKEGFATGVWFINEPECINNNYSDGAFYD